MENVERRLELIRMMRSEHKDNVTRIQRREQILYPNRKVSYSELMDNRNKNDYGKSMRYDSYSDTNTTTDSVNNKANYGFYIRLGISIGLFLLYFYMDSNNISYFGNNNIHLCDDCYNYVGKYLD